MKKKVLMSSIVTIVLCLTLIAGSTYALFTSESKVNVAVTSGNVEVKAVASDFIYESEFGSVLPESIDNNNFKYDDDSNIITIGRMVPGDYVQFNITVTNYSNVSVDYTPAITLEEDGGLWEALDVTFTVHGETETELTENGWEGTTGTLAGTEDANGVTVQVITVKIAFTNDTADQNVYQNKGCRFAYKVTAVQANAQ